jgi:serine phosphatase RsbU (regulator of sigma subunit)/HAMP domain-containing protein
MTDVPPASSFQQRLKRRSIKAKILVALLTLSLLPLILFVVISRPGIVYVREHVRSELIREAHEDLVRLAKDQATIASAALDKVAVETRMAAFSVQALLRNPSAFGRAQSYSAGEKPDNPDAASSYTLAPGVSMAAAKPELDLSRNLDKVFAFVKEGDPSLYEIYYGTQSGVYLEYPWHNETVDSSEFTLEPALAQDLNGGGEVAEQVWRAFRENGVALSRHTVVSTTEPGNEWVIRDSESNWIFSVRRCKTGLGVYWEYDPRNDPWYLNAVSRDSAVWTKYANWSGARFLFGLKPGIESQITDKVSSSLAREFADRQLTVIENGTVSIEQGGKWRLQDKNGNHYEIRRENGKLHVYSIDMLTCSRAVLDPEGRLAGVVGLDIGMHSIGRKIIDTPEEIPGYAFILNERGELIGQEKDDMFIPKAGGGIRSQMAAGNTGIEYAADSATYVAYAPISSIRSPDGKSFWSVGISMPEAEITRLADDTQHRMVFVLELGVGIIFAAMIILVIFAAIRISKGITGPVVELGAGVKRIGGGDLDYRLNVSTRDEIEELANAFNKMAGDLQTYVKTLRQTTAEKERFESELRVAHDIQMSFLKKIFPAFPDRSDFSLYATIEPAREVGGDLYDFDLVDETRLVFYVGDVSDKGVPASLVMAETMTLMKLASQQTGITPAEILRQVNVALSADNANCMFVTLFIGILDLKTGELSFSNAGHNPPLILGANGESRFVTLPDGLVLGVMPEAEYRDDTVCLEPGDMIVTYTDGVTEAMSPDRVLYSEARLRETLATLAGRGVGDTVAEIVASVRVHAAGAPQSDDIAVLALRRDVRSRPGLRSEPSQAVAAI